MEALKPVSYTFTASVLGSVDTVAHGLSPEDMRSSLDRIRREHGDADSYGETAIRATGAIVASTGYGLWRWAPEGN